MITPKRILVATDFSEHSHAAILKAIDLAKKCKAKITLVHVAKKSLLEKVMARTVPLLGKALITSEENALALFKKIVPHYSKEKIKIKHVILSGEQPAQKILKYSKDHKIDLLIIGTHGKYSIHDWYVGTTAEYISRMTTVPVLIVKNAIQKSYQKILVPLDFSNASKNALLFAYALFPKSNLKLLHVADQDFEELLKNKKEIASNKIKLMRKSILLFLSQKMKDFIKKCNKKFAKLTLNIQFGYPGVAIIKEAKQSHQDLVVMGTEGHSQRHYLFMGRTASRVLIETDKDLLLVPPKKIGVKMGESEELFHQLKYKNF